MIIFIYGTDSFRSWQKINELKKKFRDKIDSSGSNIAFMEEDNFSMSEFRQQLLSAGLFTKGRMLIIKNILSKGIDKDMQQEIQKVLTLAGDNVVVWWEHFKDNDIYKKVKQNPLFIFLLKQKFVQEYNILTGIRLDQWVQSRALELGTSIKSVAVKNLVAQIGDDLWQLNNELLKISLYTKNKEIGIEDIEEMVNASLGSDTWDFLYQLSHKNKKESIKLLEEQLAVGVEPIEIMSRMVWQFRILLLVKESLITRTLTSTELSQILGLHPYVVQKTLSVVKHFTLSELKFFFTSLSQIDLKIKIGQGDPAALLILFILDL
jgi:DNA polymerase III delta subunit